MGSYTPRHLKRSTSPLRGRSAMLAASAAMIIPAVAATDASAAPVAKSAVAVAAVTPAAKTTAGPTLRYGSSGSAVQVLQSKLRAKGHSLSADGSFGPKTRAAVRSFQAKARVGVSGIVGPATWRALGGYTAPPTSRGGSSSSRGEILSIAYRYLGIPYVAGGASPSQGFDCSGFTSYVYRQAGITIPRVARAQQQFAQRTSHPVPGDLVFFGYPAYHVGIYAGNGQMIAAPYPGQRVRLQQIWVTPSGYGHVG